MLKLEVQRLRGELSSYTVLEPEVMQLRETNAELQRESAAMRVRHEKQLQRLGDDFFKYRQTLQGEFSDMVARAGLEGGSGGGGGAEQEEQNKQLAEAESENGRLRTEVGELQVRTTSQELSSAR
eukprot:SAG11_NODE_2963_length_2807_cov_4.781019_4_plen_125_part_00